MLASGTIACKKGRRGLSFWRVTFIYSSLLRCKKGERQRQVGVNRHTLCHRLVEAFDPSFLACYGSLCHRFWFVYREFQWQPDRTVLCISEGRRTDSPKTVNGGDGEGHDGGQGTHHEYCYPHDPHDLLLRCLWNAGKKPLVRPLSWQPKENAEYVRWA